MKIVAATSLRAAILLVTTFLTVSSGTLSAQDVQPEEFASLIGMNNLDNSSKENSAFASDQDVKAVAFNGSQTLDPISIQLADLQSQISSQRTEIGRLRAQLGSSQGRKAPRFYAGYESVIVQPVQSNQSALIVETDDGYSQVMFPRQLEHSPRVEFGVMPASGKLGFRMRYWQFDHTSSFHAGAANGIIPTGKWATVGYLGEDGDVTTGVSFIEDGDFSSSIRTDVIDMELSRSLSQPIDLYAGLRYARIKQGYQALVSEGGGGPESILAQTEFRGIGPTVAMRFLHQLPLNRLSLFADARGSVLFGNQEYDAVDSINLIHQTLNGISVEDWSDIANAMTTNTELRFGIQYVPAEWLTMRVAMEAQHFGGVGGANPVAVFLGPDNGLSTDSPLDDNLAFYGLSVAFEAGF